MSERSHVLPTPEGEYFENSRFSGLSLIFAVVAVIGLVVSVIGAIMWPEQFAYSWLFGWAFFFTICAGCFFWIIVHHAVDAEWSVVVRRQQENVAMLLPLVALFFIPVFLFRHHLYEWMNIAKGTDHLLDLKRQYLNLPFFTVRALIFFIYFSVFAFLFRKISLSQDRDGNPASTLKMRRLAFIGLPLFGLCLTFGVWDWLAALNYKWFSTMWGVYIFAGACGSAMSLTVLLMFALRKAGYLEGVLKIEHFHLMGNWMLAFTVFWAYIGFSQYMLIWYANIPEETEYFILRNTESWNLMSLLLVIGRFFIPFALLLMRSTKITGNRLPMVAGWVICMQLLDMYVVVMPELHRAGVHLSLLDLAPLLGIGGTLAFVYLRLLGKHSMFPVRDPRLMESLRITT
jgi:hypothetical protein